MTVAITLSRWSHAHGRRQHSSASRTRQARLGRAIAPDMPGYGRAGKPKDFSHSVDGYAARGPAAPALTGGE